MNRSKDSDDEGMEDSDQERISDCCEIEPPPREELCLFIQSDQEYHEYKKINHSKGVPRFEGCISEEEELYERVEIDGVTFNVGDAVEIYPDDSCKSDRWFW